MIFLTQIFLANHARDPKNLFFGMTSSYGMPLLIKVGDPAAFRTFAQKIAGVNGNDKAKMQDFIYKFYGKIDKDNPDKNEAGFLNLIKNVYDADKGLTLYMGNNDCNAWTKRKLDNFGDVKSVPCNN